MNVGRTGVDDDAAKVGALRTPGKSGWPEVNMSNTPS
jgi:hypothetical protein